MPDTDPLRGKVVVITGASSGFGRGAAVEFARAGASVVLAARRGEVLDEVVAECEAVGGSALSVPADVSERVDVRAVADGAIDVFGRIDVWINNAGVGALGPFARVPLADHAQVIATNLLGTLYGSYFAIEEFVEQGTGTLINVSSELGKISAPYYASYVASKHGVTALGTALRQELEQSGCADVHVCTVLPTAHDTPFFDHAANYTGREIQAPKPLHDPQAVIDTLLQLARDPKDEKIVGADGVVNILLERVAPGLEEKIVARQMHKAQIEEAPPGATSAGAVRTPSAKGTRVRGGRRKS